MKIRVFRSFLWLLFPSFWVFCLHELRRYCHWRFIQRKFLVLKRWIEYAWGVLFFKLAFQVIASFFVLMIWNLISMLLYHLFALETFILSLAWLLQIRCKRSYAFTHLFAIWNLSKSLSGRNLIVFEAWREFYLVCRTLNLIAYFLRFLNCEECLCVHLFI